MDTFQSGELVVVHCIIPIKRSTEWSDSSCVQDCEFCGVGVDFNKLCKNGSFTHSCSTPNHRLDNSGSIGVEYHICHISFFVV